MTNFVLISGSKFFAYISRLAESFVNNLFRCKIKLIVSQTTELWFLIIPSVSMFCNSLKIRSSLVTVSRSSDDDAYVNRPSIASLFHWFIIDSREWKIRTALVASQLYLPNCIIYDHTYNCFTLFASHSISCEFTGRFRTYLDVVSGDFFEKNLLKMRTLIRILFSLWIQIFHCEWTRRSRNSFLLSIFLLRRLSMCNIILTILFVFYFTSPHFFTWKWILDIF